MTSKISVFALLLALGACSSERVSGPRVYEPNPNPDIVESDDGTAELNGRIHLGKPATIDFEVTGIDRGRWSRNLTTFVGISGRAVVERKTGRLIAQSDDAEAVHEFGEFWVVESDGEVILHTGDGQQSFEGEVRGFVPRQLQAGRVVFVESDDQTIAVDLVSGRSFGPIDDNLNRFVSFGAAPVAVAFHLERGNTVWMIDLRGDAPNYIEVAPGNFETRLAAMVADDAVLLHDFRNERIARVDLDAETWAWEPDWKELNAPHFDTEDLVDIAAVSTHDGRAIVLHGEDQWEAPCTETPTILNLSTRSNVLIRCDDSLFTIDLTADEPSLDILDDVVGLNYAAMVVAESSPANMSIWSSSAGQFHQSAEIDNIEAPLLLSAPLGGPDWLAFGEVEMNDLWAVGENKYTFFEPENGTTFDIETYCKPIVAADPDRIALIDLFGLAVRGEDGRIFHEQSVTGCGFAWDGERIVYPDGRELVWHELESDTIRRVEFEEELSLSPADSVTTDALWLAQSNDIDERRKLLMDIRTGDMIDFGRLDQREAAKRVPLLRMPGVFWLGTPQGIFVGAVADGLGGVTAVSDDPNARLMAWKSVFLVTPASSGSEIRTVSFPSLPDN